MNPLRVTLHDAFPPQALTALREAGFAATAVRDGDAQKAITETLATTEALVVRAHTRVDAELLARCRALRVVVAASSGTDHVDLAVCRERGVAVFYTPDANAPAAAEHTLALLLALTRQVAHADALLKTGGWDRQQFLAPFELAGRRAHIVGLGRVGTRVAAMLLALECEVTATDPYVTRETIAARDATVARRVTLQPLAAALPTADILSLHMPLTDETRGMITAETLAQLPAHALLVNTSRGQVVVWEALCAALAGNRGPAGVALDVFPDEPPTPAQRRTLLGTAPQRVVMTPHLGAATPEAKARLIAEVVEVLQAFVAGKPPEDKRLA